MKYIHTLFLLAIFIAVFASSICAQEKLIFIDEKHIVPTIFVTNKLIPISSIYEIPSRITQRNSPAEMFVVRPVANFVDTYSLETQPHVTFKKINPTRYEIHVEDIQDNFVIVFNETYHGAWHLYSSNESISCDNPKTFERFNTDECKNDGYTITPMKSLRRLLSRDKALGEHFTVNGTANAWYINTNKKALDITLEFQIQDSFYLSIFIAGFVLIISVSIIFFHYLRKYI